MSAINALAAQDWAIIPETLQQMANIAMRLNEGPEAVAKKFAPPMRNTYKASVRDGIAIIPLTGPIFPKANLFTQICGATSLDILISDITTAMEDPTVNAIVLDIDSPGGTVNGVSEAADIIRQYAQEKTIVAYSSGVIASAAYWLASAASEIVAQRAAQLGSIGVVTSYPVQEQAGADGYRNIELVSSNAKNKRPDPRTDEGRASIVSRLDALETQFIGTVADNRGKAAQFVKENFGSGGMLIAEEAVRVGMADRVGSFEDVLQELKNRHQSNVKGATMTKPNAGAAADNSAMTIDTLKASNPDIFKAIREEGFVAGANAERERISALETASMPGFEDLVSAAKADGKTTADQLKVKIFDASKTRGEGFLQQVRTADAANPVIEPSASNTPADAAGDKHLSVEDRCKAQWNKDEKLRAEFTSYEGYLAFTKAEEAGRVKILKKA